MRNAPLNTRLLATTAMVVIGLSAAGAASAQTAPAPDSAAATEVDDIVVTGTLLRGVAPTGTNVVSMGRQDVIATGAASSNDLLARIPQISSAFNTAPQPGATMALPINRPNIRNLGGAGGSTTLVLLNGNRMVGAGILQTSPDPSVIPPGVLERVEVIPDGGSSIYGSDAIGGVVNFITRKKFEGIEATGRYGVGDGYDQFDLNLTAGKSWDGGSGIISYAYAQHSNISGADRDYFTQDLTSRGGGDYRSTACSPGTITTANGNYVLPGRTPGSNLCDTAKVIDFYPEEERHSLFATVSQTVNERLSLDATAYYSQRETSRRGVSVGEGTGLAGGGLISFMNPYFKSVAGEFLHNVSFNYDDAWDGVLPKNNSRFTSAGFTPSLTYQINDDWRLKASLNWGRSTNQVRSWAINTTAEAVALAGTTAATALNPYNVGATNAAVLKGIIDFQNYGHSVQEIREARAVVDGNLFTLPAGDVKLAVGVEYHEETLKAQQGNGAPSALNLVSSSTSRDVKSMFAEVLAPVFNSPSMGSLDLSASVRYDSYSDVGDTTNPKIGFNYRPASTLTFRGNWGTSFHAPSLADMGDGVDTRLQVLRFSLLLPDPQQGEIARPTLVLAGGNADLKPETADTWSLGFDWRPEGALEGLTASVTYYNVAFQDAIGVTPVGRGSFFTNPGFASLFIRNPSLEAMTARVGGLSVDGAPSLASLYAPGSLTPAIFFDARRHNFGTLDVDGIDFNLRYARPASFGLWHVGLAGTYGLNRESRLSKQDLKINEFKNGTGRYSLVASSGLISGAFAGELTVNHSSSADLTGIPDQNKVSGFTTVNLFGSYDLGLSGAFSDTTVTLNIDNVFDEEPPYYNAAGGTANGSTLGRVVSIGLRKTF